MIQYRRFIDDLFEGQLYLGYFSGPVEGILIIVGIYLLSGYYGELVSCVPAGDQF